MKKLTGSFRYTQWDPWLIIFQIVSIQSILYFTLGVVLILLGSLLGEPKTLDNIFQYHVSFIVKNTYKIFTWECFCRRYKYVMPEVRL